ncbi:hypothetical protein SERLADRAFT_471423 [Serpula lacrymans var. lacrymans S7.9]|uniref:Uncharacterized protein n=1 Tax=Serpula lacrymans var. lacrymans (strain S7.9) TaxID=578457 RepID=F8P169_SERL9|nr:uncharacterized protein SERLADRAFT_471423 [Serpula lacrymans var. lacrymans S7.9]EGO22900.1 hypothetical protein SERLADRAFT_471423 [Serpula lacrymans var. lacrymans S7.9]
MTGWPKDITTRVPLFVRTSNVDPTQLDTKRKTKTAFIRFPPQDTITVPGFGVNVFGPRMRMDEEVCKAHITLRGLKYIPTAITQDQHLHRVFTTVQAGIGCPACE